MYIERKSFFTTDELVREIELAYQVSNATVLLKPSKALRGLQISFKVSAWKDMPVVIGLGKRRFDIPTEPGPVFMFSMVEQLENEGNMQVTESEEIFLKGEKHKLIEIPNLLDKIYTEILLERNTLWILIPKDVVIKGADLFRVNVCSSKWMVISKIDFKDGPLVTFNCAPNSFAIICDKVVFPNPGGPNNNTWSNASFLAFAALIYIDRLSLNFFCPT